MSILEKIGKIDKRYVFVLMLAIIVGIYFFPIAFPLAVTEYSRSYYDTIEAVPAGGVICISFDITGRQTAEGLPPGVITLKHILRMSKTKDVKIIFLSLNAEGPLMANMAIQQAGMDKLWVYGVNYVNLGWIPSMAGVSLFAENIRSVFTVDLYGAPIDNIQMMANIKNIYDINLLIDVGGQSPGNAEWQGLVVLRYGTTYLYTDLVAHFTAIYYQAGIAKGIIWGIKGVGEYELILGMPGVGLANASTLSILSLVAIAALGLCNLGYWGSRSKGGLKK